MPRKTFKKSMKKTSKSMSKMLKSAQSVQNPMGGVARAIENKNVRYVLMALLLVYSGLLVPAFDQRISPLFDSWIVRVIFLLTILAVAPQDPTLALFLVLAFGTSMYVNYNTNSMRTLVEEDKSQGGGENVGDLSRRLGQGVDDLGRVVSAPLGKVVDVGGNVVRGTVGVVSDAVGTADRATGGVVGGVVRGTERVARGVVSDIAGGLSGSRGRDGTPAGFNVGYKQCVNGKGDGLCRGVGDVGMQTQGLGVPVGFYGGETGAVF